MQQNIPTIRWRQAFVFGIPLAILELGLLVISTTSSFLPLQQAILIGLTLYVVIPAFAEYMYQSQHHETTVNVWPGVRAGLMSFSIIMLAATALFGVEWGIYVHASAQPTPPHSWGIYDPGWELGNLLTVLAGLALIQGIGVLLSAVGSLFGSRVAILRMSQLQLQGNDTY